MEGALIILAALIAVGFILWLLDKRHPRHEDETVNSATSAENAVPTGDKSESTEEIHGDVCCGQHLVCEKDSLSPTDSRIEYYDDEELDRFIGRSGLDYTDDEIEEFQEVLITLRPEDVAGWARSVTQRHLELPPVVRDELLLLVNEARNKTREGKN